jgi:hypothetical protein
MRPQLPLSADFVAEVGEEILARAAAVGRFLAARSGWSVGPDALAPTLCFDATSRNTHGDRGRRPRHQLRKPAQVLSDGRQRELELGSTRSAQSQTAEPQDALEVGEQHLDAFALAA